MINNLEFYPVGLKKYDKQTGEIVYGVPPICSCPKCGKTLFYPDTSMDTFNDQYCEKCGRDLSKPFTIWEKIKLWSIWAGDYSAMCKYPIMRIKEG